MFEEFLSDTKSNKQNEWLLAVEFLTRLAKKRFDLVHQYKAKSMSGHELIEAIEFHLAGQIDKIPLS